MFENITAQQQSSLENHAALINRYCISHLKQQMLHFTFYGNQSFSIILQILWCIYCCISGLYLFNASHS